VTLECDTRLFGERDVGDNVMLKDYIDVGKKVLDVSDRFLILVTSLGCWCPTILLQDRGFR